MIRFIVCGWHMNQPTLIDGLAELQKDNPNDVHVFWSCHREPTDFIKENFDDPNAVTDFSLNELEEKYNEWHIAKYPEEALEDVNQLISDYLKSPQQQKK